jgi:lipoate-protein ligase B
MIVEDLGVMDYREAWKTQERALERVAQGAAEMLLLVEHPPVITMGRRAGQEAHADVLSRAGVEVVRSDRGGDVTFHGPGQLVAYPIIRLNDHGMSVGAYVHRLEDVVIATLAQLGVAARKDREAIGIWVDEATDGNPSVAAKICALGVRIRRGVSMHGIALNVSTDLSAFALIIPCGLAGRGVTSLAKVLGANAPNMAAVKAELTDQMRRAFAVA